MPLFTAFFQGKSSLLSKLIKDSEVAYKHMKKVYILSLLFFILVTLSGCQMVTIDKQTKHIKDELGEGLSLEHVEKVYLTNTTFPELLVFINSNEHTKVQVHQYDMDKKQWKMVYEAKEHLHYGGLENLQVIDTFKDEKTELEHVFIGYHGGTGGFLNFYALGANQKGQVVEVTNNMLNEYPNSYIKDTEKGFDLFSGEEQVESYYWDDNSYILTN